MRNRFWRGLNLGFKFVWERVVNDVRVFRGCSHDGFWRAVVLDRRSGRGLPPSSRVF